MSKAREMNTAKECGALIMDSHIQLRSGRHSSHFFDARKILQDPVSLHQFAGTIANRVRRLARDAGCQIDVVVGRPPDCVGLAVATAFYMSGPGGSIGSVSRWVKGALQFSRCEERRKDGDGKPIIRFSPMYAEVLIGKKVLWVEDVMTTFSTAQALTDIIRVAGGNVVGGAVICNRAGDISKVLDLPIAVSLIDVSDDESWQNYAPENCPLCAAEAPLEWMVDDTKMFLVKC